MQITFSYSSGRRVAAVVLAVGADFIRVAAPRRSEGVNIYLRDEEWVTETGKTVRVDTIVFGEGAIVHDTVAQKRVHSTGKKVTHAVSSASGSF